MSRTAEGGGGSVGVGGDAGRGDATVAAIARTLLYEGYILWPYRRSALKNQRRWTIGGVYPTGYDGAGGSGDARILQAECLIETGGPGGRGASGDAVGDEGPGCDEPVIEIRARFLQRVLRQAARWDGAALEAVDELRVGSEHYLTWDEAVEREVRARVGGADSPMTSIPFVIPAGREEEWLTGSAGERIGALVRSWDELRGSLEVRAGRSGARLLRVTARLENTTSAVGLDREAALGRTFISAHLILHAAGGEFVSLLEPPEWLAEEASLCQNLGCWPVLVGEPGARHTILASPIIVYDYPQIAPESPGDLFDGTEIDHLLILNILGMTDAEKAEMRASDPHAREILERAEALGPEELLRMSGAIREFRVNEVMSRSSMDRGGMDFWDDAAAPGPRVVAVPGGEARRGSRVLLRPRPRGDVFDLALAGRVAVVEGIDQDLEGRVHLAVTLEDDPGRDLGEARQPGHRFFFAVDEVELLPPAEGATDSPGRILVAGIGNIFLADDGFGVEVAHRLLERPLPPGVEVVDFGIRGLDLAYALQAGYAAVILVDAAPRGYPPGTLSVIEPELRDESGGELPGGIDGGSGLSSGRRSILEPHAMDPVRVLLLARQLGATLPPVRVVACEPGRLEPVEGADLLVELSEPVRAAVGPAIELVEALIAEFRDAEPAAEPPVTVG